MFGLFTCVFASMFVCIDIGFPVCLPSSSPDNVLLDMLPCVCIYLLACLQACSFALMKASQFVCPFPFPVTSLRIFFAFNFIHLHLCKPISSHSCQPPGLLACLLIALHMLVWLCLADIFLSIFVSLPPACLCACFETYFGQLPGLLVCVFL